MHETAKASLHFDEPYAGLVGGSILHGWLVPKSGHHFTDVRVRVGAEVFPGIYGIPRRDLADFFQAGRPYLLAGFSVTLTLPNGRYRLALEACTLAGTWEFIDSVERDITPAEAQPDLDTRTPLNASAFGEVLRVLLLRLSDPAVAPLDAAATIIRETPERHHLQHPPRPFYGHLDQPHIWAFSLFGRLPLTGWLFHESQPIKRVFATTDLLAMQDLKYGRETPFLPSRPGMPAHSGHAGYDGFLDLPAQLPLPATVRVYSELHDGSWHLGSVARFTITDQEFIKQRFALYSPLRFWRAWRSLRTAIRRRGWQVPAGPDYRQTLLDTWRDYRAWAPRVRDIRPVRTAPHTYRRKLVHLFTHNLNHEGAPLFLLEYARFLRIHGGVDIAVTSAQEGPLRGDFVALGANVQIIDTAPLLAARDSAALRRELRALSTNIDLHAAGLVVANTLSCWWSVHLAFAARRPVLLYIHESTSPRAFCQAALRPVFVPVVEETFRLANRVSFLTPATQRYYDQLSDGSNYCINPGWIDLERIDAFRAAHTRVQMRGQLALSTGRRLVINVGTVCERKGQHLFARAVEQLWRMEPALASGADFLMIGGRDTHYDRCLAEFLGTLGRSNLRIVGETTGVYPYYAAADLFVCSSYEESFPRVLLEAMSFALPIASTGVHGGTLGTARRFVSPGGSDASAACSARSRACPRFRSSGAGGPGIRQSNSPSTAPRYGARNLSGRLPCSVHQNIHNVSPIEGRMPIVARRET
jgi:glycosyltransferase involved in cell wall biosynthesis